MGNYNDNRRSGGGSRGNFGGGSRGGDRGRSEMYQAICSECGKKCEVPFRPSAGKPVYCNDCFKKNRDSGVNRSDRSGGRSFGKRDFGRSGSSDRQMHQAICAECGKKCEVPFRPTSNKPVYCSDCFGGSKGRDFEPKRSDQSNEQHEQLNKKLDKILKILETISPKKTHIVEKSKVKSAKASPQENTGQADDTVETSQPTSPKLLRRLNGASLEKKATKKKAPAKKKPAKKIAKKKAPAKKAKS